jgi:hypothetical protein
MSFVAVAVGGSAVAGLASGAMQAGAASDAAAIQGRAGKKANKLQKRMYLEQSEELQPWKQTGLSALSGLANSDFQRDFQMSDFEKDPGYEFRMAEGQKALERSAAARGGLQSGGTLKALSRYGQDFASNEFNNAYSRFNADRDRRFGRLSSIAGFGRDAVAQHNAARQNYANAYGNNLMGVANAQGAAGMAGAQAWGGALSNIAGAGMDAAAMSQQGKWMDKWSANQGSGIRGSSAGGGYGNYGGYA